MKNLDWNQIRLVHTIGTHGNFSAAAKALGINQTTVGRQLTALESALGVSMFHRSRQGVVPTDHGEKVMGEAERMESIAQSLAEQISGTHIEPRGTIRLQLMTWLFNHLVAGRLVEFLPQHPGIDLQVIADQRVRFLDRGEADIALRFDMRPSGRILHQPLVDIPYAAYSRCGSDPNTLPWLSFREDTLEVASERWMRTTGRLHQVALWSNDTDMLCSAAAAGVGKVLLPEMLGDMDTRLERVSGPQPEIVRTLHIQTAPDARRLKRMELFLDWFEDLMKTSFPSA